MLLVCAIHEFKDKKENIYRKIGDRFEVSKERYFEIIENGGDWIVPVAKLSREQKGNIEKEKKEIGTKKIKTSKGE